MEQNNKIVLFQEKQVRRVWQNEEWFFVLNDVITVLTDSTNPAHYFRMLRQRDTELDKGASQFVMPLAIPTEGGNQRMNCANTEGILRLVQSIPSPKAEPFKRWLAQIGYERIQEIENPEIGFDRLKDIYKAKGYADEWIERRLKSIGIRKELTDEWKGRGVNEGQEYSILTAEIAKATFGFTPSEHKKVKNLDKENLRDHMTNLELIFTMLGEDVARRVSVTTDAQGFEENHDAARKGGQAAGEARERVEAISGEKVVSADNFLNQIKEAEQKQALPPDAITDFTDNKEG